MKKILIIVLSVTGAVVVIGIIAFLNAKITGEKAYRESEDYKRHEEIGEKMERSKERAEKMLEELNDYRY